MTFKTFDVVIVPFPFVDVAVKKIRPALVLSNQQANKSGSIVLAMITSAQHSKKMYDIVITDLNAGGLPAPSIIRMKLFTLDADAIHKIIGVLNERDQHSVKKVFKSIFADLF